MTDGNQTEQGELEGAAGDQTSEHGEGGTSTDEPRTFSTQQELDKYVEDTIASRGRTLASEARTQLEEAKSLNTTLTNQLEAERKRIDDIENARDREISEKLKDNPDALAVHNANVQLRKERALFRQEQAAFEQEKSKWQPMIKDAQSFQAMKKAIPIAEKYDGISAEDLATHTDGTEESMIAFAKKFGKPKQRKSKEESNKGKPDSGTGSGGKGDKSEEQKLKERYPTAYSKK